VRAARDRSRRGTSGESAPARVLVVEGHRGPRRIFAEALSSLLDAEWSTITAEGALRGPRGDIDLVVLDAETTPAHGGAIPELRRRGIPTLYVLDGIVEWRHTWEIGDLFAGTPVRPKYQPILSDKAACIGRSQARLLESLGNLGRCEVTGLLRLDPLLGARPRQREPGEPFRVLVASARTPGFSTAQIERAETSLRDLKGWLEAHPTVGEVQIEPVWRLTGGLDRAIGVENTRSSMRIADQLRTIDAVITTPSTVMLEGMLFGVPVALVDYHNCPQYVPAAWSMTARAHLDEVVPQLVSPDPVRMLHQDAILHDALECRTPAAPRLAALMEGMIEHGRACRREGRPLTLPRRILVDAQDGHHLPEERLDLKVLYPDHPFFGETDLVQLQAEVAHLRRAVALRPTQVVYRSLRELQRVWRVRRGRRARSSWPTERERP
jgi:hypothetical protein